MESHRPDAIPDPAVRRLSLYLRQLEVFGHAGQSTVSSRQLGESLRLTDAQVRKDLAIFGQFGHPGVGYRTDELIAQLRKVLGTDHVWNVILIGHGNLGRALAAYKGFEAKGFRLVAVFDADPALWTRKPAGSSELAIQPMESLGEFVRERGVRLAVMAVPAEAAQAVADLVIAAGVKGLLNFAPTNLAVPKSVSVNSVDLAVQLEQLAFQTSLAAPPTSDIPPPTG